MSVIKVSGAFKKYGSKGDTQKVLQNFHMRVEEGTIYSLMGASGCGKTTLISTIVGGKELDEGDVEVFGEPPGRHNSLIGYMPQEAALVEGFTIREMLWFYGTILGMKSCEIEKQIDFLRDLLDLPDDNTFVMDCSGGEQRRISFAVSLVHDPKLLVLDEPTVGLDSLLRTRIWDYLFELTTTKNVTILLSTHYVEEAKQSTHVGLMRNGVLVAQDTPSQILQLTSTESLGDAFFALVMLQEEDSQKSRVESREGEHVLRNIPTFTSRNLTKTNDVAERTNSTKKIMKALLTKNFLEVLRNINILFLVFASPILACLCLHIGIGGEITGLKVGIVNDEVLSNTECYNSSLTTIEPGDIECMMSRASCHYIDKINGKKIIKIYYGSYEEAFEAVKKGNNIGFMHFESNFSKSLSFFNDEENDISDAGFVQVHLDKTNLQKVMVVEHQLLKAYEMFLDQLLVGCGKSAKTGKSPVQSEYLYGSLDFNFKKDMVTGLILTVFIALAALITATSIISERVGGTWNRALVAGVKPVHFLLSNLIDGTILLTLQCFVISFYTIFFLSDNQSWNARVALCLIIFLTGFAGMMFGLLCSIITQTVMDALMIAQFAALPIALISGTVWPLEGMPVILKYLGFFFPLSMPVVAFRRILVKDIDFGESSLFYCFFILMSWICAEIFLSIWLINKKEFEIKRKLKD